MVASILIIVISVLLFAYWFRYTCTLILSTKTSEDYSREIASANRLCFAEVLAQLDEAPAPALDGHYASLDRDYTLVSCLLRGAAGTEINGLSIEEIMLRIDYAGMKAWYFLSRKFSDSAARAALREMSQIVGHFANAFGERRAGESRA